MSEPAQAGRSGEALSLVRGDQGEQQGELGEQQEQGKQRVARRAKGSKALSMSYLKKAAS